jgi:hypothetical protein
MAIRGFINLLKLGVFPLLFKKVVSLYKRSSNMSVTAVLAAVRSSNILHHQ